ncbi:MAG: hypothetical protein P1V51_20530 [Deltaproteobacteria bacterium]|nr:hypothetical protein [Deltaproteobacteria bacterium]
MHHRTALVLPLLLLLLAPGCPKEPAPEVICPVGFEADAGGRCVGVVPAEPCPGGSMRLLGERECVPIGPDCPLGFESEDDGWGCRPVVAAGPCVNGTREALGDAACQPVADCRMGTSPDATHFVDPAGSTDATHFRSIRAAVSAAPQGAVIAVAAGTYVENVVITRPITLIGSCPTDTILQAPALDPGMGILFQGVRGATVSHLTVRGFLPGLGAVGGAEALVVHSVIEDSIAYGAIAIETGTRLSINQSAIRGTRAGAGEVTGNAVAVNDGGRLEVVDSTLSDNVGVAAYVSGTGSLHLDRTVVLRTTLDTGLQSDAGVKVHAGGTLWIGGSAILGSSGIGVVASDPRTRLTILDSTIADTVSDDTGLSGFGLAVLGGADATIEGLTSTRNHTANILVRRSTATLERVVSRDTLRSTQPWTTLRGEAVYPGVGIWIALDADASLTDVAVLEGHGETLHVDSSRASLSRVFLEDRTLDPGNGTETTDLVALQGSQVEVAGMEIRSRNLFGLRATDPGTTLEMSRLLLTFPEGNPSVLLGGSLECAAGAACVLRESWFDQAPGFGLMTWLNASTRIEDSVISNTREAGPELLYGDGVSCLFNSTVHIRKSEIRSSAHVGLWLENCGGSLVESRVLDNTLGLRAGEEMVLETVSTLPSTIGLGTFVIDEATVFEGNSVRISTESVVLPETPTGGDPPLHP